MTPGWQNQPRPAALAAWSLVGIWTEEPQDVSTGRWPERESGRDAETVGGQHPPGTKRVSCRSFLATQQHSAPRSGLHFLRLPETPGPSDTFPGGVGGVGVF